MAMKGSFGGNSILNDGRLILEGDLDKVWLLDMGVILLVKSPGEHNVDLLDSAAALSSMH